MACASTAALVPTETESRGPFLSWDAAQAAFQLAPAELPRVPGLVAEPASQTDRARSLIAPLRPLNNITTVALGGGSFASIR